MGARLSREGSGRWIATAAGIVSMAIVLTGCGAQSERSPDALGATESPSAVATPNDAAVVGAGAGHTTVRTPAPGSSWWCSTSATEEYPLTAARQALPQDFRPVALHACSVDVETVPGKGQWLVATQRNATSGLEALVTALRAADEHSGDGACAANFDPDPMVWLIDAHGRGVLPRWPRNGCGHLQPAATAALAAVSFTTTETHRLRQITPQAVIDSGCATGWKDMLPLAAASGGSGDAGSLAALGKEDSPPLCVYRVTERGDTPSGTLVRGRRLTATQTASLISLLEAAGPQRPCQAQANLFAVIGTSGSVYVELDGCQRVLTGDNGLRQATPALLAALGPG